MMARTAYRCATLFTLIALVCASVPVHAQVATSTNFTASNISVDSFGGDSTSTSFSSIMAGDSIITGDSTSTSFQVQMGPMYFDTFTAVSQNWRWWDDTENETPITALANENTAPSNIGGDNPIKLRITVKDTAGVSAEGTKFKLQYSTFSDFSTGVSDVIEIGSCNGNSAWCYYDGAGVDDAVISTGTLSDADACAGAVGDGCGTHNESGTSASTFTHPANAATEYEFTIKQVLALPNTVYFFRLYYVPGETGVPLQSGASYPSILTGGTSLTFSINGLEAATSTEGVTTDITTTGGDIAFGTLPISTTLTAAQRLTVSTNATQGYEIFTFAREGFIATNGAEIDPVTGTNISPSGWNTGCNAGAPGCFGYHAGDDVLNGGSTRFAANDTYAQFSTTTPNEVAYSAGPATDRSTDVVYRVVARGTQDAGEYSTEIVYIVVPTF